MERAVGAYLMVASDGSGKGWTIDASGVVNDVAPAAVVILSPSINGGWTPPLIVDSTTAVIVRGASDGLTANAVNLRTGAVRPLLTVPYTGVMAEQDNSDRRHQRPLGDHWNRPSNRRCLQPGTGKCARGRRNRNYA
jgi:hypothetical protein